MAGYPEAIREFDTPNAGALGAGLPSEHPFRARGCAGIRLRWPTGLGGRTTTDRDGDVARIEPTGTPPDGLDRGLPLLVCDGALTTAPDADPSHDLPMAGGSGVSA